MAVPDHGPHMQPVELGAGLVAITPTDLAGAILAATDKQVAEKSIADADGRADFALSSDALNYWRLAWRCSTEWGTAGFGSTIAGQVMAAICSSRGYDPDDLDSALQATKSRARLPFGWTALDLAWWLTGREPIVLMDSQLAGKRVPTAIAGLARHLQMFQAEDPILLPIDQIRKLLQQRKIVVSGAVQRLLEAKILEYADRNYHTGKAREFRFIGIEGEHYKRVAPEEMTNPAGGKPIR